MRFLFLSVFMLTACASNDLYEPCRPTGSLLNPFGSGCNVGSCFTDEGIRAVTTPSRWGICTYQCSIGVSACKNDGVCNGKICLPKDSNSS